MAGPSTREPGGDSNLLAEAGCGSERAAAQLYDAYADALYAYGLRHLGDAELAEDLVQQVLEKLWRRAELYDPQRGPVAAYTFAIARSTVADLRRAAARLPRPVDGVDEEHLAVDDAADRVLLAASVRAALDRLTSDHRRVLDLAYRRGLTQRPALNRM